MFKVGDKVSWELWEREWEGPYTVEKVLAPGVYRVGNSHTFVDLVPEALLRPYETGENHEDNRDDNR